MIEQEVPGRLGRPELKKFGTATVLTTSLLMGSTACGLVPTESGPEPLPQSITYPTDEFDTSCQVISDDLIIQTENLFTENLANEEAATQNWKIAKELGLTVYDFANSKYEKFARASYELYDDEISVDEAIQTTKDFLNLYDVELVPLATKDDQAGLLEIKPYTKAELDNIDKGRLKRQLVGFIDSLSRLPVELVHYMGLKRVVFAHGVDYESGETSVGFVDPSDRHLSTVYINPDTPKDDVLLHEMFHLWDMKECGPEGTLDDEQYASINPIAELYTTKTNYRSVESEWEGANGSDVVVMRDYGFFSVSEDKATMGEAILGSFHLSRIFDVYDSRVLKDKAVLLLSRIKDDRHEIAEYLARSN